MRKILRITYYRTGTMLLPAVPPDSHCRLATQIQALMTTMPPSYPESWIQSVLGAQLGQELHPEGWYLSLRGQAGLDLRRL